MQVVIFLALLKLGLYQIDFSTIDDSVEFVHSQYSCILTSQVSTQFVFINNSDNFRIKCLSYSKISAIVCVLFCFYTFFNHGKNIS